MLQDDQDEAGVRVRIFVCKKREHWTMGGTFGQWGMGQTRHRNCGCRGGPQEQTLSIICGPRLTRHQDGISKLSKQLRAVMSNHDLISQSQSTCCAPGPQLSVSILILIPGDGTRTRGWKSGVQLWNSQSENVGEIGTMCSTYHSCVFGCFFLSLKKSLY